MAVSVGPPGLLVLLAVAGQLPASETLVVHGYARLQTGGPILISLSPIRDTVLTVPAAPVDSSFVPPGSIHWEVRVTGTDSNGNRTGTALRTVPADFDWPAGEEIAPGRYQGSLGGLFPSVDSLDPLNVALGSGVTDYDQDGVPDDQDAFPGDPGESLDTDGDGLGDHADPDDDSDGIPDTWEIAHGTDPLVDDTAADYDGDGFTTGAEYLAGTEPWNAASFFRINSLQLVADSVRITFDAVPARTYTLFYLPDLAATPAVLRSGLTAVTAQPLTVTVPKLSSAGFYFLRVSATPTP